MPRELEEGQMLLPLGLEGEADPLAEFFWSGEEQRKSRAHAAPPPVEEPRREYLAVRLANEEYAIPIERIREIQKLGPITEVPRGPRDLVGVLSLRGEIVPVLDPRLRLGLERPAPTRRARVVIADPGDGPCAVLVDDVLGVVHLASSDIEAVPAGISADGELLTGVTRAAGRLLVLLDLTALLTPGAPR